MEKYNWLQFYDYTKLITRVVKYGEGALPANYHLTYSASEVTTDTRIAAVVPLANVAVVFSGKTLPDWYLGFPVLDGDTSDERFQDVKGCIVGLKAKGKGRKDTSGFVRHCA